MSEQTLVIIKPDGVKRHLVGAWFNALKMQICPFNGWK